MSPIFKIMDKKSVPQDLVGQFLTKEILPRISPTFQGTLRVRMAVPRKDLIDADILSEKGNTPIAELRLDLLDSPATLHLFIHHYPFYDNLKRQIEQNKHLLESILKKKIALDSSYGDALHALSDSMHRVAQEMDEFRSALTAITKVNHTSGFPKYGYAKLPASVKKFESHLPSSMTFELYRGKILPKAAVRFHFKDLHDKEVHSCVVSLSPDLYKEVMVKLKPSLDKLQDRMGDIFKKTINMEYWPLAKT